MLKNIWSKFVKLIARLAGLTQQRAHHFYPAVIGNSSVVVDLGAHKGEFAQFITAQYGASVIGLEANPHLFTNLPKLPRTKFLNLAIHHQNTEVVFNVSDNPEASSVFKEVASATGNISQVSVTGKTLDTLFTENEIKSVDLLKVDIESAEFQMLELASEEALARVTQITVEFHITKTSADYSAARIEKICQRLQRLGFTNFVMDRDYTDVLFLKKHNIPWRFSERLAMVAHRVIIMPGRRILPK